MDPNTTYQSAYANSWALIIGINKYKHASPLSYATNDANGIAETLSAKFGFKKEKIRLLLDDKATISAIRKSFMAFADAEKVTPDDRLVVFFAGHGYTAAGKRGEVGFLVPADGKTSDLDTLIRWDELTRNAELIPAKHIFFVMDACYGGLALQRSPAFGNMRFLGDMLQRYARQVLTAGKADETVADGNGVRPGHSIFTAHLLDALEGSAATEEGVITANGVMAYVYDRVARDQYSHQTPHYGFVDGDGDFIFDTSLLDKIRATEPSMGGPDATGESGEKDILINTSPEIATMTAKDPPVVDAMKELLSEPSKRIKLDDFISRHVRRFLDQTDLRHFPVQGAGVQKDEFAERVARYQEISKDLQNIVILLARWADREQLQLLEKIFTRLAEADKGSSGLVLWLRLSWYPILLLMYSAGIAALTSRKYDALRTTFLTPVQAEGRYSEGRLPLVVPAVDNVTEIYESFKLLPGHERHYAPRSEHFFKILQPELEDLLLLGRSYESMFDEFEVLLALVYSDVTERDWGPPGRFGWKHRRGFGNSPFDQVMGEAKKEGANWGPIKAGLFQGSPERFTKDADAYGELLKKLSWF